MQYYYNNIALLFATGRTWQKHPLFLSYLLQSPRKATFHVPFRFVWPVKWVEDLQRESYKLLQQLPNRERAATALWFYHCMQVTVVPWLLWAVWLSTGTVCDSNFDACFEYVRLVLCKSIVYERFLRYFCRPLLSGTCPVRLILFCFPSACALGSIESLHFTPSKQFSLQFASKASLDMPGINICRCQCRKQLGLRSGHSLLNFQRTYQRDWVEKTSTFSSCDETVLWCRALFSNTLRLHQPL